MPRMDQQLIDEFLAQPYTAVIAALKQSGGPYTVPIVFLWEDGCFHFAGTYNRIWCRLLLRDPRMSISVEAISPHYGHVSADGLAEAIEQKEEVERVMRKIFEKSPPDVPSDEQEALWQLAKANPSVAFRMRPDKIRAIDMSIYQGKRRDREHQASLGLNPRGRTHRPKLRFTVPER